MKNITIALLSILLMACGSPLTTTYDWEELTVSGEFLFEGPNTLQGQPGSPLSDIARSIGVDENRIKSITISSAQIILAPDSLQSAVESALVQWVSNDLDLVSVATKSPIDQNGTIELDVKQSQDILPYIKDANSTLVVDLNLNQDLDFLEGKVALKLNVTYKN